MNNLYLYQLTKMDNIPVNLGHKEKIEDARFVEMLNECMTEYQKMGNKNYATNPIAKLMKAKFGFEEVDVQIVVLTRSPYPGLFNKDELDKKDNVIYPKFDREFWMGSKF